MGFMTAMAQVGTMVRLLITGEMPPEDPDDLRIAYGAYRDFLIAQLIGYGPERTDALLKTVMPADGREPPFFALMGAETRMLDLLDDQQIERNYWIVRDRLNRVGADSGITEHNLRLPNSIRESPAEPANTTAASGDADEPILDVAAMQSDADAAEAAARHAQSTALAQEEIGTGTSGDGNGVPAKTEEEKPATPANTTAGPETGGKSDAD